MPGGAVVGRAFAGGSEAVFVGGVAFEEASRSRLCPVSVPVKTAAGPSARVTSSSPRMASSGTNDDGEAAFMLTINGIFTIMPA